MLQMDRKRRLGCRLLVVLLSLGARTALAGDWPCIFGPTHDGVCAEADLELNFKKPPKILWSVETGEGYSAPSIVGGKLILFHRIGDEEVVDCLDASSGKRLWRQAYPTAYVDRYGYNGGPRCTPIIAGGRVYTYGAEGKLHAFALVDGRKLWSRDLNNDYKVEQGFFGVGATPLLEVDRLVVNVGGKTTGAGIVAVDVADGETLWKSTDQGASYATPTPATIHGKKYIFVFTEAGLVSVDPPTGTVHWSIPFRSKIYESVNATSPAVEEDVVLVSATYRTGSLCLRILPDGSYKELWRGVAPLDSHFSNMVVDKGHVYAFSGRHQQGSSLRCLELLTGKVKWERESPLGRGSMTRVGKQLLLWGEEGNLASIDLDSNAFRGRSFLEESLLKYPCWTPPAISAGRLYLRNERRLICLDISKKSAGAAP